METIKAVLFDNDGTLVDTYGMILASMRHAIGNVMGEDLSDHELMRFCGTPLDDQMVYYAHGDAERAAELARVYREHNATIHDQMIHPFEGIVELLDELHARGIVTGVVTAKLLPLCEHGLEICGLRSYMDVIVTPDTWPEVKPAPGPVLHGCEVLGAAPAECLYVGDSPYDMQAGNAAHCPTVAALWGMYTQEELMAEGPTYRCEDPLAILDLDCMQR